MSKQLIVDIEQAHELIALGYTVICTAYLPRVNKNKHGGKRTKVISKDGMFTYNITGTPVAKGNYKEIWDKVVNKLWNKDVKAKYTREFIEEKLIECGLNPTDKSMFAFLANKKGIIKPAPE